MNEVSAIWCKGLIFGEAICGFSALFWMYEVFFSLGFVISILMKPA